MPAKANLNNYTERSIIHYFKTMQCSLGHTSHNYAIVFILLLLFIIFCLK